MELRVIKGCMESAQVSGEGDVGEKSEEIS